MEQRRIAVIEDEPSIAASVAARLRAEGFEVELAADGPTGVELCRSFRPDLVVLDLMLPGLPGLEVCRRIQRDRHVPVLMLTARAPRRTSRSGSRLAPTTTCRSRSALASSWLASGRCCIGPSARPLLRRNAT